MDTDSSIMDIFPQNGLKLELVENKIRDIFILYKYWYLIKQLFHPRLLDMSLLKLHRQLWCHWIKSKSVTVHQLDT